MIEDRLRLRPAYGRIFPAVNVSGARGAKDLLPPLLSLIRTTGGGGGEGVMLMASSSRKLRLRSTHVGIVHPVVMLLMIMGADVQTVVLGFRAEVGMLTGWSAGVEVAANVVIGGEKGAAGVKEDDVATSGNIGAVDDIVINGIGAIVDVIDEAASEEALTGEGEKSRP